MTDKNSYKKYILCLMFFICMGIVNVFAQDHTLTAIGNAKGTPADIKMKDLQSVLKGEKQRWEDGTKISIALLKTSTPGGAATSKKIYNMSADQLNKYWLALVFQGKAKAPIFFNSAAEVAAYVSITPGAIGVIDTSDPAGTKVIQVEGHRNF